MFSAENVDDKSSSEAEKIGPAQRPCPSSNLAAASMLLLKFAHKNRRRWEAER